ncbi:MAG: substrate-binding domain-containing protein [Verrucomicrobia bacterium]|nr:substrate-binding domain-containing protein [Verrucomicrobiota bacterium]MCH8512007.1 substrate-binding domain-containing protein [Kiritimatiellia bacterium]
MTALRKVSVVFGNALMAPELFKGIGHFLSEGAPWIVRSHDFPTNWGEQLRGSGADGFLVYAYEPDIVQELQALGVPVVNVSTRLQGSLPTVTLDNRALGTMAAEHLLSLGVYWFGFLGRNFSFSRERFSGFRDRLFAEPDFRKDRLFDARPFMDTRSENEKVIERTRAWMRSLPKPIAIFTEDDELAQLVSNVARESGWEVPGDVAVLGCNNRERVCFLGHPPLSSIDPNGRGIGHAAARLLERMMQGESIPGTYREEIFPHGVVQRQSTDVIAVPDPCVAQAVRWIRENHAGRISVEDVVRQVPLSRCLLERSFRQYLGHTPLWEIKRTRVEKVCELLVNTNMGMEEISAESGFQSPQRMARVFKDILKQTPTEYRRKTRR